MISFDAAHAAVHYPPDRRFRIWIRPSILIAAAMLVAVPVLAAWIEFLLVGLPHIPPVPQIFPNNFAGPHGFPVWVRYCHFFNFLFVTMLIRSGLSILADHPRLYFNNHCTPGSEWIRLTPIIVPDGSGLDREGRCALRFAARCHARLPAYHRPGPVLALSQRLRLHYHGIFLCHHALRYRAVAAARTPIAVGAAAGLEHLGTLCDIPPAD